MKIYTKTGDMGTTSLVGGKRIKKHDVRIEAYGTIDELNAFLGLLKVELCDSAEQCAQVEQIQATLLVVGGNLATDESYCAMPESLIFDVAQVQVVEMWIDTMQAQLKPLKQFVLSGDNRVSALCHVCRVVARRAERCISALSEESQIDESIKKYINRLSDFLFVLSRFVVRENIFEKKGD